MAVVIARENADNAIPPADKRRLTGPPAIAMTMPMIPSENPAALTGIPRTGSTNRSSPMAPKTTELSPRPTGGNRV